MNNLPQQNRFYAGQDIGSSLQSFGNPSNDAEPLRPEPLRLPVRSRVNSPVSEISSNYTTGENLEPPSPPSPQALANQQLPSDDQFLQHIHHTLSLPPADPEDTSLAALLLLLRLKLNKIPTELLTLTRPFLSAVKAQPQPLTPFKRTSVALLEKYLWRLQREQEELDVLIKLGEDLLEKEKRGETDRIESIGGMFEMGGTKTERQVWWFVARSVLTEAGQEV
jgi:hypothetical protein